MNSQTTSVPNSSSMSQKGTNASVVLGQISTSMTETTGEVYKTQSKKTVESSSKKFDPFAMEYMTDQNRKFEEGKKAKAIADAKWKKEREAEQSKPPVKKRSSVFTGLRDRFQRSE